MFQSNPSLFLTANNYLYCAQTLINKCKASINSYEIPDSSNLASAKKSINSCNIDAILQIVDTTKASLLKLDKEFLVEYMSMLEETVNNGLKSYEMMTAEEIMQYNIQMGAYIRDYNYSLLYKLEQYESAGMLTDEMKKQLEIQRIIVAQYDIQDKMAVLNPTSDEYIDLFKQNAEYEKKLIIANPKLTDTEKADYLKEYNYSFNSEIDVLELNCNVAKKMAELQKLEVGSIEYYEKENIIRMLQINYYSRKDYLTDSESEYLQNLKDGLELNKLYVAKKENNDILHPFIEKEYEKQILAKKRALGISTSNESSNINRFDSIKSLFSKDVLVSSEITLYYKNKILQTDTTDNIIYEIKNKTGVGLVNINTLNSNSVKVNSVDDYKLDFTSELEFANTLKNAGYTDEQIATQFAIRASQCTQPGIKRNLYNFAYNYLNTLTGSKDRAMQVVVEAFETQIENRGMTTVIVDNYGIEYNKINDFYAENQAYTLDYVKSEIASLPEPMRKSLKEINFYDLGNPNDLYSADQNGVPGFISAATGGNGQINLYENYIIKDTLIEHEAAHCFDSYSNGGVGKFSTSEEYNAAMKADLKATGKKSVTTYGETNNYEDFAESMAYYLKDPDNFEFPNRKKYFEKILSEDKEEVIHIGPSESNS